MQEKLARMVGLTVSLWSPNGQRLNGKLSELPLNCYGIRGTWTFVAFRADEVASVNTRRSIIHLSRGWE